MHKGSLWMIFTAMHSADYAATRCLSVSLSVGPSVRLSVT